MTSKLGYIPEPRKCLANNLQIATDGNVIYNSPIGFHLASAVATATTVTLTTRQVLGGLVLQDPSGGAVTTTLPTAAALVAAMPGVAVGSSIRLTVMNTANAAETITVAVGTGITNYTGTVTSLLTVAQNDTAEFFIVFTNVSPGSEAATLYCIGNDFTSSS